MTSMQVIADNDTCRMVNRLESCSRERQELRGGILQKNLEGVL
jgi:hypothetical protein